MACIGIDTGNIYLWLSLAGLFFGGGLSFILSTARRRKPVVSVVLFSIAILCLLAAFVLSGFNLADYKLELIWLSSSAAVGYLCFLFWKTAGIPFLLVSLIIVSGVWFSFYSWSCAGPETEICRFRTISEGAGFVRIQYEDAAGISAINKVEGESVYPLLETVRAPDYFFLLNKSNIYKFYGFGAEPGLNSSLADGVSGVIFRYVTKLPGFILRNDDFETIKFSPSIEYLLLFGDDGEPEISRRI